MARAKSGECTFCAVVRGELPSHAVLEDERCVAFLDHKPLFPGHVLLVPRAHHATLAELPAALVEPLFAHARLLARAVEEAVFADGSYLAINNKVSQSVPHLHVHVVPRREKDGLFARGMVWKRQPYPDEESRLVVRDAIRAAVARLAGEAGERE